jgi:hypothetical protein
MEQITTIGLDLAKNVFQVHGVDGAGKVLVRKQLRRAEMLKVLRCVAAVPGRLGGLRYRASLGSATDQAGAHGSIDAASLC